jgi:hypothetical protein
MKVGNLEEGMLLAVAISDVRPIVRDRDPGRLTFFPDIFATSAFGSIRVLDHKSYFFYLGKRREVIPEEYTAIGTPRTKSHHEVMDKHGHVYRVHGREFKNFEPVWREDDSKHSND